MPLLALVDDRLAESLTFCEVATLPVKVPVVPLMVVAATVLGVVAPIAVEFRPVEVSDILVESAIWNAIEDALIANGTVAVIGLS